MKERSYITGMSLASTLQKQKPANLPVATLGGGCFWCLESEFRRLEGVVFTESGYAGGQSENPTYEEVCTGITGHAEVTDIYFDPAIISYAQLLDYFLTIAHDPTQKDGQGVDLGTQYRSAIFYHDEEQLRTAQAVIAQVNEAGRWPAPIVTTLEPYETFWPAEAYHQQYYETYETRTGVMHPRALYKQRKRQNSY